MHPALNTKTSLTETVGETQSGDEPGFFEEFRTGIAREQLHMFAKQASVNQIATAACTLIITSFIFFQVGTSSILIWGTLQLGLVLIGTIRSFRHPVRKQQNAAPDMGLTRKGLFHAVGWAAASGATWGVLILFLPDTALYQKALITLVVTGMVAGSATTLASVQQAAVAFNLTATLPFGVYFLLRADSESGVMGLLALVLTVTMIIATRNIHRSLQKQIYVEHQVTLLRRAHFQERLAALVNRTTDTDEALRMSLRSICEYLGWPVGHVYFAQSETGGLRSTNLWHLDHPTRYNNFLSATYEQDPPVPDSLAMIVAKTGQPQWIENISTSKISHRLDACKDAGFCSAFAVPVFVSNKVAAVLEFFTEVPQKTDQQFVRMAIPIGIQIGRSIERRQADKKIQANEIQLRNSVDELQKTQHELQRREHDLKEVNKGLILARQQAEAANLMKSEFLASMSHELRTPLNAIMGFSEIIAGQSLGPIGNSRYLKHADHIHSAGTHLLALVNDILDLSKVESGSAEPDRSCIEPAQLANASIEMVRIIAGKSAVNLSSRLGDDLPLLYVDERQIKQVLINLLGNAVKFNVDNGSVILDVQRQADGIIFQVSDTGIGIAEEDMDKALSRFGQVDGKLTRTYEGTGLGLPLARALVDLHDGDMEIESQIGKGTTVTVWLPSSCLASDAQIAPNIAEV